MIAGREAASERLRIGCSSTLLARVYANFKPGVERDAGGPPLARLSKIFDVFAC